MGSSKEVIDVQALQGYLKEVLVAFAEGKNIPAPTTGTGTNASKPGVDLVLHQFREQ